LFYSRHCTVLAIPTYVKYRFQSQTCTTANFVVLSLLYMSVLHTSTLLLLPPRPVTNQPLESNLVTSCRNATWWQNHSFLIFFYHVQPSLLWTSNRAFPAGLLVLYYGWPPLFFHFDDISVSVHYAQYSLLFLSCSFSHLYLVNSIHIFNTQYTKQLSIITCIQHMLHICCEVPGFTPKYQDWHNHDRAVYVSLFDFWYVSLHDFRKPFHTAYKAGQPASDLLTSADPN